jgi:hypothetical protein
MSTDRGGQMAPPHITMPQYAAYDSDCNGIGPIGCGYLSKGRWGCLQKLGLGKPAII